MRDAGHPQWKSPVLLTAILCSFVCGHPRAAVTSEFDGANGLARVRFIPHWIPQAQFAGIYVAAEKGIFRKHGLDVDVIAGGPRKPVGKLLESGEATFGSHFLSSALRLRNEGVEVVNLAQITQKSALMLLAFKSRIRTVQDLAGKRVSVWPDFAAQPQALFKKYGIEASTLVQGATINLLLRGAVDAASAMWYNEYHLILNSGVNEDELTLIFYDDHGLNYPEDGIYTMAETWRARPDVCRRFARAALEGWEDAFSNPEEALAIVMRRTAEAQTGTNRAHQRWMLQRMKDVIRPAGALSFGSLAREDYDRVAGGLVSAGIIKAAPPLEDFYVAAHH